MLHTVFLFYDTLRFSSMVQRSNYLGLHLQGTFLYLCVTNNFPRMTALWLLKLLKYVA